MPPLVPVVVTAIVPEVVTGDPVTAKIDVAGTEMPIEETPPAPPPQVDPASTKLPEASALMQLPEV